MVLPQSIVNHYNIKKKLYVFGLYRSPAADLDANNNYQTAGVRRDKNTPSESLSKSREEDLETAPVNTPENNPIHDVQQSKRRFDFFFIDFFNVQLR